MYFFGHPTNKTVTGTACIYVGTLLIAIHLDQSIWSTNHKYWAAFRSNLLQSFLEVHNFVAPFTSHGKLHKFGAEIPISWAKPAHFHIFTINFTVWSHTLSTGGDALTYLTVSIGYVTKDTTKSERFSNGWCTGGCLVTT